MNTFVDTLNLRDVSHYEGERQLDLYFTAGDNRYYLFLVRQNGVFQPRSVIHETNKYCSFCDGQYGWGGNCYTLHHYVDELYQRLIAFPSVRLPLLYIPHSERMKER